MLYFYGLSFVQIVAESFPVSSSGHVLLWQRLWRFVATLCMPPMNVQDFFDHLIPVPHELFLPLLHIPTIVLILLVFHDRIMSHVRRCLTDSAFARKLVAAVMLADSITVAWYLFFKITGMSFSLAIGFFVTACIIYSTRFCSRNSEQRSSFYRGAAILGMVQGVALLPGISRLGVTIAAALWLGCTGLQALEISLLLQMPLLCAAVCRALLLVDGSALKMVLVDPIFIIAIMVASLISYYSMRLVRRLVEHNYLWAFSYYLIIPCLLALCS